MLGSPLGPLDPALRGAVLDHPLAPKGSHGPRVLRSDGPSLAPTEPGATQSADRTPPTSVRASSPSDLPSSDRVEHPLSQLPSTLAGMEDAFQRLAERAIDTSAIAALIGEVRQYGSRAYAEGAPGPVADNTELMTLAARHLDRYHAALGMLPHDIAALQAASRAAGHWYPSASVPVNVLQYAIPALLGATGHPHWSVGIAGLSAGFGFLLTGLLQQPLAVLPSEHTAERRGPVIHVDKTRVNYAQYLPRMASQAERVARSRTALPDEARQWALDPELPSFLARATPEQRATLRRQAEQFLEGSAGVDREHRLLLSTEGAHERQREGVARQLIWRVARPVGQGMTGLLSGVDPRTLDPSTVADQVRRIGRRQQLPPLAIAGLQVLWLLICQVGQHASAGADEQGKVHYKAMLDIAFADLVKPGEGTDRFERGLPLRAEHIDTDKCRARVLGPVQSLARRVERVLKSEIARTADGSEVQLDLRRQLNAVRAGRFTELDPTNDRAGRMMLQASRQGIWRSMFNPDSALHHDIRAKHNHAEHVVQWTQRGTQSFHLGIAGSAASSMSTRIVTTAFGGASHTPTAALLGVLAVNTLLSWLAAWTAAETQTLKNFGKEGQVLLGDVEGGTTPRPPSTRSQIGHGLISGVDLVVGQHRAQRANRVIRQHLNADAQGPEAPVVLARRLLDALDAVDGNGRGPDAGSSTA